LFLTLKKEQHNDLMENIKISWQNLQGRVNGIYDSNLAKIFTDSRPSYGVKQVSFYQDSFFMRAHCLKCKGHQVTYSNA